MFRRYGSWLLLLCAIALVCLPSMAQPVARILPDAISKNEDIGRLNYIIKGNTALLDLNRATLEELVELPKVGQSLAQRILDWREANGPFAEIEDIMQVDGIGNGIFAAISPYIGVSD